MRISAVVLAFALILGPAAQARAAFDPPADAEFVQSAYHTLLARPPDTTSLQTIVSSGAKQSIVIGSILSSNEFLGRLVGYFFSQYLHRPAGGSDRGAFVPILQSGTPPRTILASVLGSPEYYGRAGSTPGGYVAALYNDILHRPGSGAERGVFENALATGSTRTAVASMILSSTEGSQAYTAGLYRDLLGRSGSPPPGVSLAQLGLLATQSNVKPRPPGQTVTVSDPILRYNLGNGEPVRAQATLKFPDAGPFTVSSARVSVPRANDSGGRQSNSVVVTLPVDKGTPQLYQMWIAGQVEPTATLALGATKYTLTRVIIAGYTESRGEHSMVTITLNAEKMELLK